MSCRPRGRDTRRGAERVTLESPTDFLTGIARCSDTMSVQVLIDSIVRQVTVLIAQLATSGGIRAPVAHLANQVFLELANELEAQGVSRKVSADMFGMALRAYIRKVRRLSEAQTEHGRTLWQAVLEFIREEQLVSRERVLERFRLDGELEVSAVLHDLTESHLVFGSGGGRATVFRAATDEELGRLAQLPGQGGIDELAWVLVYRNGPLSESELGEQLARSGEPLGPLVERLIASGRVERDAQNKLMAPRFVIPLDASAGWEAAVFDHLQALVQTVCQRLRQSAPSELVGGSTYNFDIWPGHPLESEVKGQLADLRRRSTALRLRVDEHNQRHGLPRDVQRVTTYMGQCWIDRDIQADSAEKGENEP